MMCEGNDSFADESEEDNINLDGISNPQQVKAVKDEVSREKRLEDEIFGRFK